MILKWILLATGIVNFALLVFQMVTGLKVVRLKFTYHRTAGIILFCVALVHAVLAIMAL